MLCRRSTGRSRINKSIINQSLQTLLYHGAGAERPRAHGEKRVVGGIGEWEYGREGGGSMVFLIDVVR